MEQILIEYVSDVEVDLIHHNISDNKCSFPNCKNSRSGSFNICRSHRRQQLRGVPMSPLQHKMGKPRDGKKHCAWCKLWLPLERFSISNSRKNKFYPACIDCTTEYNKYTAIRSKYKLNKEQYDKMALLGCQVCGKMDGLVVDHDHRCCKSDYTCGKCVRGVLCSRCNLTLGKIEDDVEILEKMIGYLNRGN